MKTAMLKPLNLFSRYNARHTTLCSTLSLEAVLWAARLVPSKALRRFKDAADLDGFVPNFSGNTPLTMETYQIKLIVQPGGGIFEVSLIYLLKEDTFTVKVSSNYLKYTFFRAVVAVLL